MTASAIPADVTEEQIGENVTDLRYRLEAAREDGESAITLGTNRIEEIIKCLTAQRAEPVREDALREAIEWEIMGCIPEDHERVPTAVEAILAALSQSPSASASDGVRMALETVLPMAKGYASAHPVGRNREIVEEADAALAASASEETAEGWRETLEYYADQLCEGWCKNSGGSFDDCGGCKARCALEAAAPNPQKQGEGE